MTKLLIPIVCFLFFQNINAQNDKYSYVELDSLMYIEYRKGDYEKAISYMQAGSKKAKIEFGGQDSIYAEYINNIGFFYSKMGQYEQAERFYLQSMEIRKKGYGEQHVSYASSLNNLANLYKSMGNYTKAEPLFLETIAIEKKALGEDDASYGTSLNNLAYLYDLMGNYSQAEPLYLQTMAIWKKALGEQHPYYALSLNNLASLYLNMGLFSKAEPLYLQATSIRKKTLGELSLSYATSLSNLSSLYVKMNDYTKAKILNLQALDIWKRVLGVKHPSYVVGLNNLVLLYISFGELDTAFDYCKLSMIANAPKLDSTFVDWENLDHVDYTSNIQINLSLRSLLTILQKQYDQDKDQGKLEHHYIVSQAAIRLNERFRNEFTGEGDKLRVLAENNEFVLAAIQTGMILGKDNYEATAFGFAEMNKGILLLEASKATNARQFGGLPDTLAEQEKQLQKTQSSILAKLLENRPDIEKDSLRKVLNEINHEIDLFTNILKNKFPKYAALKYDNKTANAKDIQALLDDQTALLEYMVGDSVIYIFYLDKNQVKLTATYLSNKVLSERTKSLHNALSNYRLAVAKPATSYHLFTDNSSWFYENLVAIPLKDISPKINKLIIVADGQLGHLPFEAFLTKPAPQREVPYNELSYLINTYAISYNYSSTLFVNAHGEKTGKASSQNNKSNTKNNGQILAMASNYNIQLDSNKLDWRLPLYQRMRVPLQPLLNAQKEVEVLANNFNGFFAFDNSASEKIFKEKAENFAVIHLAMHGLLDSKEPILSSLAFTEDGDSLENNFLQAYEISKMKLKADLVVLSACETGYGRFEKGNGIASLAQAFAYAGAPAMIVSLWQVNDYATSVIMKNLYQNLADGMPKDEALQQAKLYYLSQAKGITAHPAFWSPFILIGDDSPIYISKTNNYPIGWIIGAAALLLLIGVFVRHKRKEK